MDVQYFLSRKLTSHLKVKVFSFLGALFLWFYVVTDNVYVHVMQVPLRLVNQPRGWILTHPIPSHVQVRFRGSGKDLISFLYRDKYIVIDFDRLNREVAVPLRTEMIEGVPPGMEITAVDVVSPDSVIVSLDRFAARKVPVIPRIVMKPMDGYIQVGRTDLKPDSILVSGPKTFVSTITEVVTDSVVYDNLVKDLEGETGLVPPPWETVRYSEDQVDFAADIQRIGERTLTEVPITVTHVPPGIKVTVMPSTLSLKLQGGVERLSGITRDEVVAAIDYRSRYRYRGNRFPAAIDVPEEIIYSDVKPQFFELIVER